MAEKKAWLTAHPEVQPAEYRTVRGLEYHSKRWLNQTCKGLPLWRLDLATETLNKEAYAAWTDEEVETLLDYQTELDREADQEAEEVAISNIGVSCHISRVLCVAQRQLINLCWLSCRNSS